MSVGPFALPGDKQQDYRNCGSRMSFDLIIVEEAVRTLEPPNLVPIVKHKSLAFAPRTVAHGNECLPGLLIGVVKGARGVEKITAPTSLRLDRNSRSLRTSKWGPSQRMGFKLDYARLMEERMAADDISAEAVRIRPLDSVAAPTGTALRRGEISIYTKTNHLHCNYPRRDDPNLSPRRQAWRIGHGQRRAGPGPPWASLSWSGASNVRKARPEARHSRHQSSSTVILLSETESSTIRLLGFRASPRATVSQRRGGHLCPAADAVTNMKIDCLRGTVGIHAR